VFVQWEGTSFPIEDEMDADKVRLYTSDNDIRFRVIMPVWADEK
jgi:hypothetical protein